MKRIRLNRLSREYTHWRPPVPFPGNYPTRWSVCIATFAAKTKRSWFYRGKPNQVVAQRIVRACAIRNTEIQFEEYDKGGRFARFVKVAGVLQAAPAGTHTLTYVYYPFMNGVVHPWEWWAANDNTTRIRLTFEGDKCIVYATENAVISEQRKLEHLLWLEKELKSWRSTLEKSKKQNKSSNVVSSVVGAFPLQSP